MACIVDRFCPTCKKNTQHVDYPDNYNGIDEGCQECFRSESEKIIDDLAAKNKQQAKDWSEMTLEEKVENLNNRLKDSEVNNMRF